MANTLSLCFDEGDLELREEEVASITDQELAKFRYLVKSFADALQRARG